MRGVPVIVLLRIEQRSSGTGSDHPSVTARGRELITTLKAVVGYPGLVVQTRRRIVVVLDTAKQMTVGLLAAKNAVCAPSTPLFEEEGRAADVS